MSLVSRLLCRNAECSTAHLRCGSFRKRGTPRSNPKPRYEFACLHMRSYAIVCFRTLSYPSWPFHTLPHSNIRHHTLSTADVLLRSASHPTTLSPTLGTLLNCNTPCPRRNDGCMKETGKGTERRALTGCIVPSSMLITVTRSSLLSTPLRTTWNCQNAVVYQMT
jgi:hypothetical protein